MKNPKSHKKNKPQVSKAEKSVNKTVSEKTSSGKTKPKWWFYAILVSIPILIIVLLEAALRIFNYGYDSTQWVDAGGEKYIINPSIGKKYFSDVKFVPATNEDVFDQVKKENAFRVFILGESSAAGYPYMPAGSFSRYIRKRLELTYPGSVIEVVNLSMTGISSHVIRDLVPGVLEQKPDLILIYIGHNEYYGALGSGSAETLGSSPSVVRLRLWLNEFKITQLLRNTISGIMSLFSSDKTEVSSRTLMSRMAKDQEIRLNSDEFNGGIEQFRENLSSVIEMAKQNNIPVIMGKLVSNLKDQKPFISVTTPGYQTADKIYSQAKLELNRGNTTTADSLFRLAKDLDGLRFRAPEKINTVISELGAKYKIPVVKNDSLFSSLSPAGIPGDNLFTDHLHPNLKGYQLIGKGFYEVMGRSGVLPSEQEQIPFANQDSITCANFMFTKLDSVIGDDIIALLKNDFPFTKAKGTVPPEKFLIQRNFIDSIAFECISGNLSWADAHVKAAAEYLKRDDMKNHVAHMNMVIYQYPTLKDYNSALKYFYESKKIDPSIFTTKRIGIIYYYTNNYDGAIKLLNEVLKNNEKDADALYYLSLSYLKKKNYKEAYEAINKCLAANPNYPEENSLKKEIQNSFAG